MKLATTLILTILFFKTYGQELTGKYRDYFGHRLHLKEDSTFRFDWRFDLIHTWSIGKWKISGPVIHLHFKSVLDTLVRLGKPDSLVLSLDEISSKVDENEFLLTVLVSGGQRSDGFSEKLIQKGKRLYRVDKSGKIIRKRHQGIWPQKRWLWGYKKWPRFYKKLND